MEKAVFSLKMTDGTLNNVYGSSATFTNLNLRQILGENLFWDYKYYNLILDKVQIAPRPGTSSSVSAHFKIATINVSSNSIDFMNCYDVKNNYMKRAVIGYLQFETYTNTTPSTTNGPVSQYFQNQSVSSVTFVRPSSEYVDLTIDLRVVQSDALWSNTNYAIQDLTFIFSVYPIYE